MILTTKTTRRQDAEAITRLYIRGLMSEAERDKCVKRMIKMYASKPKDKRHARR